jgi:hypothetical protein
VDFNKRASAPWARIIMLPDNHSGVGDWLAPAERFHWLCERSVWVQGKGGQPAGARQPEGRSGRQDSEEGLEGKTWEDTAQQSLDSTHEPTHMHSSKETRHTFSRVRRDQASYICQLRINVHSLDNAVLIMLIHSQLGTTSQGSHCEMRFNFSNVPIENA